MSDPINPPHYKIGGIEAIDVIEAWKLDFCLGNALKYIARAGKKNPAKETEDLLKAVWYLQRKIDALLKARTDVVEHAGHIGQVTREWKLAGTADGPIFAKFMPPEKPPSGKFLKPKPRKKKR